MKPIRNSAKAVIIRDNKGKNHQFAEWDMSIHQVEFYFQCELEQIQASFEGSGPDENQVGVEWIRLQELEQIRVYPHKLVPILRQRVQAPCYLGDTN
ncbi:hypothetical protein [Paenibacillus apiarius]|uniref:hypothetical protein n=1 Tax=Paenibacillus apiarius TaxID=46240 RepID=UPI001980AEB0|nr:hypothetical protein [Paenibacillus apiarius]MBN3522464.1 hypothetical protein [Paenibacillus apiarius]